MGSVFLIGFMASGKSTIGRELASRGGLSFVDLDRRIEDRTGQTIEKIFADRGEAAFRALETEELTALVGELEATPSVVATGGGTPIESGNLEIMRAAGLVLELDASFEVLVERARNDDGAVRPLMAGEQGTLRELFRKRAPIYRRAHASIRTDNLAVDEVVRRGLALIAVTDQLAGSRASVSICALERRPVPIILGNGALAELGQTTAALLPGVSRIGVVSDANVGPLYLERACASLRAAGHDVVTATFCAGEQSKTLKQLASLLELLATSGLDRNSAVVALGGGVVGDVVGFAAATLFRGIAVVQVPTSLLAMTDSSIGGKTGVNLPSGKNLAGAFWQPRFVLIDPSLLETLPERELRAGIGELFKYGLLEGAELYELIETYAEAPRDSPLAESVIERCAAYKAWVVARDEREISGERALLNLGHTVGHAIERAAGYGTVLHGEAVALGLVAAARVSSAIGRAEPSLEKMVCRSLERAGLDADLAPWLRADVLSYIGVDKKRTGDHVKFVTPLRPGSVEIVPLAITEIAEILLHRSGL